MFVCGRRIEDDEAVILEADLSQPEALPIPDIPRDRSAPGQAGFRSASLPLSDKFWRSLLYVTDDAIEKLYSLHTCM